MVHGMRNTDELLKSRKLNNLWECLVLLLTGFYILFLSVYNTTYNFPTIPQFYAVLYCMSTVVLLRTIATRQWNREVLLSLCLGVIYYLAYRTGAEHFLLFLAVISLGTVRMNYKSVLKIYVAVVSVFCLLWVTSSFGGLLSNLVYYRSGHLRSSWGMAYPTDFASTLLFLLMMIWLAWERLPDAIVMLCAIALFLVSWIIMESRTTMICSVLLCFMAGGHYIIGRYGERSPALMKCMDAIRKVMIFIFPIFCLFTMLSVIAYAKGYDFANVIDDLLSGRLNLTWAIYLEQGIHPFGRLFYQMGNGGNTLPPPELYFLDGSYPLILIRYGWVLLVTVCILWVSLSYRAYRKKDYKLLAVMTLIAFHALAEHHFLEINYNILLALPFAQIPECENRENIPSLHELLKRRWVEATVILGEAVFLFFAAPVLLSRMRTVLALHCVVTGWKDRTILLSWVFVFLSAVFGLSLVLCRLARAFADRKRLKKSETAVALICLAILVGYIIRDNRILQNEGEDYTILIQEESADIEKILDLASGKVCVENVPELYKARFAGIDRTILNGDDLARMRCGTVIVNADADRQRFTDMGFGFTMLSDRHAVYSNDAELMKALGEDGFVWTDYYSVGKTVDLDVLADANELDFAEDGSLILEPGDQMDEGPWIDLFAGRYTVTFDLKIQDKPSDVDRRVCTLVIRDHDKARVLEKREVYLSEFNENGELSAEISYYTNGSRNAEFVIFPSRNQGLAVTEIRYQKTGRK